MAKNIKTLIKLQIPAGKANPSPPVGPALGQQGVNIMEFCKAFNASTSDSEPGMLIPVVITVYSDKSFSFIKKTPPTSVLLLKAAGVSKGSPNATTQKVGKVLTMKEIEEIARIKLPDLNITDGDPSDADVEVATRTVMGCARSAGIKIEN